MTRSEIQYYRLYNQYISYPEISEPDGLVRWLCGIQAQDYSSAKWAIGLRINSCTDKIIEKSIIDKSIIRTWMFRGTLHIVSSSDFNWLLNLMGSRLIKAAMPRNKQLGLDEGILKKCMQLLDKLLKDGHPHTRLELSDYFKLRGIELKGNMLSHILQYSALNGQICCGPRIGTEFTYMLFDIISDKAHLISQEESLVELACRYFRSHGPATMTDFIWWSGITIKEGRTAIGNAKGSLTSFMYENNEFWMSPDSRIQSNKNKTYLLPAFDSYIIAYRDRSIFLDDLNKSKIISSNGIFRPIIVHAGKVVGTWNRSIVKNNLFIETKFFTSPESLVVDEILKCAYKLSSYLEKDLRKVTLNNKTLLENKKRVIKQERQKLEKAKTRR